MLVPLLCLVGGTLAAWGVAVWAAGETSVTPTYLAVAITLPPAVMTLLAVVLVCRRWPNAGPLAVMAGTFVRMVMAVGAVALLRERAAEFGTTATALAEWTTGFYLITLVLETGLLWRLLSRSDQPAGAVAKSEPRRGPPMSDRPPADSGAGDAKSLALISTAVMQMVVPILAGVWLDDRYGWSPWGLVVGTVIGFGGGFASLVWMSRRSGGTKSE